MGSKISFSQQEDNNTNSCSTSNIISPMKFSRKLENGKINSIVLYITVALLIFLIIKNEVFAPKNNMQEKSPSTIFIDPTQICNCNPYLVSLNATIQTEISSLKADIANILSKPGPKGDPGPIGPQGLSGTPGPAGSIGPTGPAGVQGPKGDQGPTGLQGLAGIDGRDGEQGLLGPAGPKGDTGLQGPPGDIGAIGPKGDTGDQGPIGPTGSTGEQGIQGIKGPAGQDGAKGDNGDQGLVGPAGPKGETGLQGPQGDVGPTGPQGLQGIQGPKGDQGDIGTMGPTGPKGDQGIQGIQGEVGAIGPQGPIGLTGTAGEIGPKGETGLTGQTGPTGPQGSIGSNGATGPIGATGSPGPQGQPGTSPIGTIVYAAYKNYNQNNQEWVTADGRSLSNNTYPGLYALIGTTFGSTGLNFFNIPDLRGRTVIGTGSGTGLTKRTLAGIGGEENHTLTIAEMPSHQHQQGSESLGQIYGYNSSDYTSNNNKNFNNGGSSTSYTKQYTSLVGLGSAHNNMMPFISLYPLIRIL